VRTRDLKKQVRQVYPTAVCEKNGDVQEINVLLPYGKAATIATAFEDRDAWYVAWRIARAQLPLDREKR